MLISSPPAARRSAGFSLRRFIRGATLCRWFGLPALLLHVFVLSFASVSAASAAALVSNMGQSTWPQSFTVTAYPYAQQFRTGTNSTGYTLTSIQLRIVSGIPSVQLWSATESGDSPGTKLADLTTPSSPSGTVTFAAPPGTMLAANTSYFVVIQPASNLQLSPTLSPQEDSGRARGWSIADFQHLRFPGVTWSQNPGVITQMAVNGEVNAPPPGTGVWSAMLTPRALPGGADYGCNNTAPGNNKCSDVTTLTDDDFEYRGRSYTIRVLQLNGAGELSLWFTGDVPANVRRDLVLTVGSEEFPLSDFGGSGSAYGISATQLNWSGGGVVVLGLKQVLQVPADVGLEADVYEGMPVLLLRSNASVVEDCEARYQLRVKPRVAMAWPERGGGNDLPGGLTFTDLEPRGDGVVESRIGGVVPGETYELRAHCVDDGVAIGRSSAVVEAMVWSVPGKPEGVVAGAGVERLDVSWEEPGEDGMGGEASLSYRVRWRALGGSWNEVEGVEVDMGLVYRIGGLSGEVSYQVQVRALNGIGSGGLWSEAAVGVPHGCAGIWCAVLTVRDLGDTYLGCGDEGSGVQLCALDSTLTRGSLRLSGVVRGIRWIRTQGSTGIFGFALEGGQSGELDDYTLYVGGRGYELGSRGGSPEVVFDEVDGGYEVGGVSGELGWSVGEEVALRLVLSPSGDNDLRALSASASEEESGSFVGVSVLPEFASGTTEYTVSVSESMKYLKLMPEVAHSGAKVRVGKSGELGSAEEAILLALGSNEILVEVTAVDGSKQVYRVVVTREGLTSAVLSGLRASFSDEEDGTFSDLGLTPSFEVGVTEYRATVIDRVRYVKLSPTMASGVTVELGKAGELMAVASDESSAAIELDVGENVILVEVTGEGDDRLVYRLRVERLEASKPLLSDLRLYAGGDLIELTPGAFSALRFEYAGRVSGGVSNVRVVATWEEAEGLDVRITSKELEEDGGAVLSGGSHAGMSRVVRLVPVGTTEVFINMFAIEDDSQGFPQLVGTSAYRVLLTREAVLDDAVTGLDLLPGDTVISLSWRPPVSPASGYDVEYKWSGAPDAAATGSGDDPTTGWVDAGHDGTVPRESLSGLRNGTEYDVRVRATVGGESGPWAQGSSTPDDFPVPTNGSVSHFVHENEPAVSIVYPMNPDTDTYDVRTQVRLESEPWPVLDPNQLIDAPLSIQRTTFPDGRDVLLGLRPGTRYEVRWYLTFEDGGDAVPRFSEVFSFLPWSVPGAPVGLRLVPSPTVRGRVDVSWSAPLETGGPAVISGYRVRWRLKDTDVGTAGDQPGSWNEEAGVDVDDAAGRAHVITGLRVGAAYEVQVRALNAITGDASIWRWSEVVEVRPLLPRLSFAEVTWVTGETDERGVNIAVDIAPPLAVASTVGIVVRSGSASGVDYSLSGLGAGEVLSLPADASRASFVLTPVADMLSEGNEEVVFGLVAVADAPYRLSAPVSTEVLLLDNSRSQGPADFEVLGGHQSLRLSWTAVSGDFEAVGYEVSYKTSAAPNRPGRGADAATGWVIWPHSGTVLSGVITGLVADTSYDVRVAATGEGAVIGGKVTAYSTGSATPIVRSAVFGEASRVLEEVDTTPDDGEDSTEYRVEVLLSSAMLVAGAVEVRSSGVAKEGGDWRVEGGGAGRRVGEPLILALPEGSTSASFVVRTIADSRTEGEEAFMLELRPRREVSGDVLYGLGAVSELRVAIQDTSVSLVTGKQFILHSPAPPPVEGEAIELTVVLGEAAPVGGVLFTVSADFTGGNTASEGDVGAVPLSVVVAEGETQARITIPGVDDQEVEEDERFVVRISTSLSGWSAGSEGDTAEVTIVDDEEYFLIGREEGTPGQVSHESEVVAEEGEFVVLPVSLSAPAPQGGLRFVMTPTFAADPAYDKATLEDVAESPQTTGVVPAGAMQGTIQYGPILRDRLLESAETFTLTVTTDVASWRPKATGENETMVRLRESGDHRIAFGTDAESTRAYTASVYEGVGAIDVPITVSTRVPSEAVSGAEYTVPIDVVALGSTASGRGSSPDYTIATSSVTFSGKATEHLSITIAADAVNEAAETIQLRLRSRADRLSDQWQRHPRSSLATITIQDGEPFPDNVEVSAAAEEGSPVLILRYDPEPADAEGIAYNTRWQIRESTAAAWPSRGTSHSLPSGATVVVADAIDGQFQRRVTGLASGTSYQVRGHYEYKGAVVGRSSGVFEVRTWEVPGAPVIFSAKGNDRRLEVSWAAPTALGGAEALTGYRVRWRLQDTDVGTAGNQPGSWNEDAGVDADNAATRAHVIRGLSTGRAYEVQVRALNGIDPGSVWSAVAVGVPLDKESNASLETLTVSGSTDGGSTYRTAIALTPAFDGSVFRYTAEVPHAVGRVRLSVTTEVAGASVQGGPALDNLIDVRNGSLVSDLFARANTLYVEVTSRDGTTKRRYEVTITRVRPPHQVLTTVEEAVIAETVGTITGTATLVGGVFPEVLSCLPDTAGSSATLGSDFSVGAFSFAAGATSAEWSVTIQDDAILESPEVIVIRIDDTSCTLPGDVAITGLTQVVGDTSDTGLVMVLLDNDTAPEALEDLRLVPSRAALTVSWEDPENVAFVGPVIEGYDLQYKLGTAADQAATGDGTDPSTGWVTPSDYEGEVRRYEITGLTDNVAYDVRVRGTNQAEGPWLEGSGTPMVSQDASLSGLSVRGSTAADGSFSEISLRPVFASGTRDYKVLVADDITHLVVTPVASATGKVSQLQVGKSGALLDVVDGTASAAIGLSEGENELLIEVTAEDGVTKQVYTVMVARALPVSLSAQPNPVEEGGTLTVTASLTGALEDDVLIPLVWEAGTAEDGDYSALSSVTVSAGETSGTGTITIGSDADADDETFTVRLGSLPAEVAAGSARSVEVVIEDDEREVSLSAAPNPVEEGAAVTVTVRLGKAASGAVEVPVVLETGGVLGTAEDGDYGVLTMITVADGETSGTGSLSTNQDMDADDETFTVRLGSLPASLVAGSETETLVRIRDDDARVSLSAEPVLVAEGSAITLTATLSRSLGRDVVVPLVLEAGTAEDGDYGALASVTVMSGETSGTGTIMANEDEDTEDETFTVRLGALPAGLVAGRARSVEVVIADADALVSLGVAPNPVLEGASATVTVTLSRALASDVAVPLVLEAGTAEDGDYGALASVTVRAGETSGTGTLSANEDVDTDNETLTVRLGDLSGLGQVFAGSPSEALVTITDNDLPQVSLSVAPNPVEEGGTLTVTVALTRALAGDLVVPLVWEAGTSEEGDYSALASITVGAGETSDTGTVTINEDDDTDDETFTVRLGSLPREVVAGSASSAEVVVRDDDVSVVLSATPSTVEEGGTVTLEVLLSEDAGSALSIPLVWRNGTAEDEDYERIAALSVAAGERIGTAQLGITEDSDTEDETFTVGLGSLPSGVVLGGTDSVEITVQDDDVSVSLSVVPSEVEEGLSVLLRAELSEAVGVDLSIPLRFRGEGSEPAEAEDYVSLSSIAISAGELMGSARVRTNPDEDSEDETIEVSLALDALPSGVVSGERSSVLITIVDDDRLGETAERLHRTVLPEVVRALSGRSAGSVRARVEEVFDGTGSVSQGRVAGQPSVMEALAAQAPGFLEGSRSLPELLGGSGFALPLSVLGEEVAGGVSSSAVLWGSGDFRSLSGVSGVLDWDGSLYGADAGVDVRVREDWLLGLSFSWSRGDFAYREEASAGDYGVDIVSVQPYVGWRMGGMDFWAMGGYGLGTVEVVSAGEELSEDLDLWTVGLGGSGLLWSEEDWAVRMRGEFLRTEIEVEEGEDTAAVSVSATLARFGLEGSRSVSLSGGGEFRPSLSLGGRYDGGEGDTGAGVEVSAGVGYVSAGGRLSARLSAHGVVGRGDYEEWGLGGFVELKPSVGGRGWSFTLRPGYGSGIVEDVGTGRVWTEGLRGREEWQSSAATGEEPGLRLESRLGYGVMAVGVLWTPWGSMSLDDAGRRYRLGMDWGLGSLLRLKLSGERYEGVGALDHGVLLEAEARF